MIRAARGDITTYAGGAIVNAANNHLRLGAGVAGAIARRGGPAIQAECDRHGAIRVGEAALTGAGDLACRFVIHAATMGDEPVSERSIGAATLASLRLAASRGIADLAFPILGTGIGGFPFRRAVEIMVAAARDAEDRGLRVDTVLYGYTAADAAVIEEVLARSP
ncbi:MAG TPA: macro domain-containing protein [Gemmatimonadales bacterium]|nr:macro domain-containing protein [Gemmatimonadales bacterium]